MHWRAVKGRPPQIVSWDIMDQVQLGRPCQLFAEFFLQPSKHQVLIKFTRNQRNAQFATYLLETENRGILVTYMYYQQHKLRIVIVSDIIVKYIRAQLTYFHAFYAYFLNEFRIDKNLNVCGAPKNLAIRFVL